MIQWQASPEPFTGRRDCKCLLLYIQQSVVKGANELPTYKEWMLSWANSIQLAGCRVTPLPMSLDIDSKITVTSALVLILKLSGELFISKATAHTLLYGVLFVGSVTTSASGELRKVSGSSVFTVPYASR